MSTVTVRPKLSPVMLDTYRRAARLYASTWPADPYVYGRTLAHLCNGIASLADVIGDARGRGGVGKSPLIAAPYGARAEAA